METTETGLAKVEGAALAPATTQRAIILREALQADTEQRALLAAFVKDHMQAGTDYGVIPGTQKPTLLKPGAEKLTDLYRCTAKFKKANAVEDWDKGLFFYEFRCQLVSRDTGTVLAEGYGSANSKEARYRWRDAQPKCPKCGKSTVFKSKQGEGFFCWSKKGGCGMNFTADDPAIANQPMGKVENDDIFSLVNTILKMATKRAQVAAAIALARCSDIFTQDLEDLSEGAYSEPAKEPPAEGKREAPRQQSQKAGTGRVERKRADLPVAEKPTHEEARKAAGAITTGDMAKVPPAPVDPEAAKKEQRAKKIRLMGRSSGYDAETFPEFVKRELGAVKPSAEWTWEDMDRLEYALSPQAWKPKNGEPPPPQDADFVPTP